MPKVHFHSFRLNEGKWMIVWTEQERGSVTGLGGGKRLQMDSYTPENRKREGKWQERDGNREKKNLRPADLLQWATDWQIVTEEDSETADTHHWDVMSVARGWSPRWRWRGEGWFLFWWKQQKDVVVTVQLLDPRDGRQAAMLAGKQTVGPRGVPALSRCHYLSVSISPWTGLAYR